MKINKKLAVASVIVIFILLYCAGVINFPSRNSASTATNSAQNSQSQKSSDYTAEDLAEAVQLGKDNKFNSSDFLKNYQIGYNLSGKDFITVLTPYLSLFFNSASVAKEYKELSSEEINSYQSNNVLEISVVAYGDEYGFGDDLDAVIKMGGQIIHPTKKVLSQNVDATAFWPKSPKYSSVNQFYFRDFSIFKGRQFQFVLIRPRGEIAYDVDMNKYK